MKHMKSMKRDAKAGARAELPFLEDSSGESFFWILETHPERRLGRQEVQEEGQGRCCWVLDLGPSSHHKLSSSW